MNKNSQTRIYSGHFNPEKHYPGLELEIFKKAVNWKNLVKKLLRPYLTGDVLEVGAGIGGSTRILCTGEQQRWVCLEPDAGMAKKIKSDIDAGILPSCCEIRPTTITGLNTEEKFDAILYIDVLEHIRDDKLELEIAGNHTRPGGVIAVLAPAHQLLFSVFDNEVGHYRRYSRVQLQKIFPSSFFNREFKYLDCIGLFASLANKYFLKRKTPSQKQIIAWDKTMVPLSRKLDPITGYKFGKSILGVWMKKHPMDVVR